MDIDQDRTGPAPAGWRALKQRLAAAWMRVTSRLARREDDPADVEVLDTPADGLAPDGLPSSPAAIELIAPAAPPAPVRDTPKVAERRPVDAPLQPPPAAAPVPAPAPPPAPPRPHAEPEFLAGSFTNAAGTRDYRLFLPGTARTAPRPLLVMLHGCRQNPEDFAAGTRMNELAQAHGIVVLYPGQSQRVNHLGCWNWFHAENQGRDRGEPSIIADLTREVIATRGIDPRRVWVAGLSAGGAMAAVLAANYPDLFAAVGIHSGLPHAAAHNLATALRAMRHGPLKRDNGPALADRQPVPTIVFHGDEDTTVHPDNGDEVIAQARWGREAEDDPGNGNGMSVERGAVPGGRTYTRTIHRDADGRCDAEHWLVHRSGHAWSGGSAIGSYTDPLGPDASVHMLRFFIEHPQGT